MTTSTQQSTAETEFGILCSCGATDLRTRRTIKQKGYIIRRRECRVCGKRTTTTERPVNATLPNVTATCSAFIETSIGQMAKTMELLSDLSGVMRGELADSRHELFKPRRP